MQKKDCRPRFLIVSPYQCGMGPVVLHLLCRMLSDLGYDARVFRLRTDVQNVSIPCSRMDFLCNYLPFMNRNAKQLLDGAEDSVKGCVLTDWPYVDDDTIVVYPEIVFGNPLAAKHVVRWFLNINRFKGKYVGLQPYGEDDLFLAYLDVFNDYQLNPSCRKVTLSYFNHDVYKRWNYGHREGNCFLVRKGRSRPDLPASVPGIIIDGLSEKEKVEVMNKCKYFYSYDPQTFYSSVAAVCGCVSIVIPEPGKCREDYTGGEAKGWGIAYGTSPEELEFARDTQKELHEFIESFEMDNQKNVQKFLVYCRDYFKGRMGPEIIW